MTGAARDTSSMRVLIAAGGTGGHVFPALAVAERLRAQGVSLAWVGTAAGLEAERVPAAGIDFYRLGTRGIRGKGPIRRLLALFMVLRALLGSLRLLHQLKPHLVLGMGGYVSGPAGVAAWLCRVPLVIHEQNAIPGLTNRLLAPLASVVLEAFPGSFAKSRQAIHTGNPLRAEFLNIFGPSDSEPPGSDQPLRLLILGGSQGALRLNEFLPAELVRAGDTHRLLVWHQAGRQSAHVASSGYAGAELEARVDSFIDDMADAYTWADLVICRAGAMTIAELAQAGVASVLVPFPLAVDDHQTANARYLVDAGAAVLMAQSEFSPGCLSTLIDELVTGRDRLRSMAIAARRVALPRAADDVARYCLEAAHA